MTKKQKYAAGAAVAAAGLLAWWLWPKKVARRKSELTIDANVYSETFGLPLFGPPAPRADGAINPDMQRLIDESNAAIAADDAENKG